MVYWDRVVVLNGIVDYLLLLSAAWLSGLPLRRGRLILWAALGGLYAGAVFLPGLEVLGVPVLPHPASMDNTIPVVKIILSTFFFMLRSSIHFYYCEKYSVLFSMSKLYHAPNRTNLLSS